MPDPINLQFGAINLSVGAAGSGEEMPPETPFRLLISGDFTGDAARAPLEHRKPIPIDRDNFDEVLAKLAPRVVLAGAASGADMMPTESEVDIFCAIAFEDSGERDAVAAVVIAIACRQKPLVGVPAEAARLIHHARAGVSHFADRRVVVACALAAGVSPEEPVLVAVFDATGGARVPVVRAADERQVSI